MLSPTDDDSNPRTIDVAAVRAANEALRRDLYAQRAVVAQLQTALQAKLATVSVDKSVSAKTDQPNIEENQECVVEPMDDERPPTPHTPPLPPPSQEKPKPPSPERDEKKPVQIFDPTNNSYSAELAVPQGSISFDQKEPQLPYRKKKLSRSMR
jgi:hypothetical protein